MNPTGAIRNRWLALGGLALALATSGCSELIAHRGVSSVDDIYGPETRTQVRAAFGEADETRTCPNGLTVERRSIRQKDPRRCHWSWARSPTCFNPYLPVFDPLMFPFVVYRSEKAKLHYAFVYDADDRVLYRYDLKAGLATQFFHLVPSLTDYWPRESQSLSLPVKTGGCTSREACFRAFAAEVRQRAACVDYPLTPQDEETLHLMQALAAEVDAGRLVPDDTLAEFEWCLGSTPFSCLRP